MPLQFYNTLTRKKEIFKPIEEGVASMYTCGPTVYDFAHIGNLRTYIFEDILRRTLLVNGFQVTHAMNITDVGHLAGDTDFTEDKMELGAKREGRHPLEIAKFYEGQFLEDMRALNILSPHKILRATESVPDQTEIIKLLEDKGFTYQDEFAVYFDTSKLLDYGKLTGQNLNEKKVGARDEVIVDEKKKNPADFVLWFFLKGKYEQHILRWPSPWGDGFPGWHIECSAIARKLLGQPFDIHMGGVDHVGTHHTNEIAQSEAAFGVPLANYWMHGEFLLIDSGRMGKSEGNFITLASLIEKGFSPLDYRYFTLGAHYRTQLNFTWEALAAARQARRELNAFASQHISASEGTIDSDFQQEFSEALNDDLNISKALGVVWKFIKEARKNPDSVSKNAFSTLLWFDQVLGLGLKNAKVEEAPSKLHDLMQEREQLRQDKKWEEADTIRKQIETHGWTVEDTADGPRLKK